MNKLVMVLAAGMILAGCGTKETATTATVGSQEVSSVSGSSQEYLQAGIQYLQNADPAAAIKSFDLAIRQNPTDPKAYMVLGETYIHMQQYNRAIDTLTAATRVAPTDGHVYYLLAVTNGLSGDKEQAKINAEKSIVLFQRDQDAENLKKSVVLLKGLVETK